jgi:hypothetical protein
VAIAVLEPDARRDGRSVVLARPEDPTSPAPSLRDAEREE